MEAVCCAPNPVIDSRMKIKRIEECASTNALGREVEAGDSPVMIIATAQTAGRGQKGNSWESEPGKNLTFSVVWRPENIHARDQFVISEAVALAVRDFLKSREIEAKVKWPNDIYVDDRKICGILIEHSLTGSTIDRTIAGVGVNINQKLFLSDAPNPVSVLNILGEEQDLEKAVEDMAAIFEERIYSLADPAKREETHLEFLKNLWHGDGDYHPFRDVAEDTIFDGKILDVCPDGPIKIKKIGGEVKKYQFKEVEFLLKTRI